MAWSARVDSHSLVRSSGSRNGSASSSLVSFRRVGVGRWRQEVVGGSGWRHLRPINRCHGWRLSNERIGRSTSDTTLKPAVWRHRARSGGRGRAYMRRNPSSWRPRVCVFVGKGLAGGLILSHLLEQLGARGLALGRHVVRVGGRVGSDRHQPLALGALELVVRVGERVLAVAEESLEVLRRERVDLGRSAPGRRAGEERRRRFICDDVAGGGGGEARERSDVGSAPCAARRE